MLPAISVNKGCFGHHIISPCSCPAGKPWENSGWTQTSCQPLISATAASPQWCILRGFRMEKTKIQALDNYNAYQTNDFSEPRLSHLPIHRKAQNSLTWEVWFSLFNGNFSSGFCCKNCSVFQFLPYRNSLSGKRLTPGFKSSESLPN